MQAIRSRSDVQRIYFFSEGLIRDAIKSKQKLDFFEYERPFGIQIFGGDEEAMALSAGIVDATNPDLVDINFGCPVKKVVCKGAGAAVLKDIESMVRLTRAVIRSTRLPVTVKTRLGWDDDSKNIEEVAERLQDVGIEALTIHGRTRSQLYKGEADWSLIAQLKIIHASAFLFLAMEILTLRKKHWNIKTGMAWMAL